MEVVKHGNGRKQWSRQVVCTGAGNGNDGCGAELIVYKDDLYQTEAGHYDGSTDIFTTFMCIDCGAETDIDVSFPTPKKQEWLKKHPVVTNIPI